MPITDTATESEFRKLFAAQQISNVLAQHSRGVDRADLNLLAGAYHPDATVDYGFFNGPAADLAAMLAGAQKGQPVTLHRTSNMWIMVDGDQAKSESYVIAYMEHLDSDGPVQRFVGGRYLDRHALRDGEWRISHRTYVMDWNSNHPSTAAWPEPSASERVFGPRGGQGAADPGRALLALGAARLGRKEDSTMSTAISDAEIDSALSRQAVHNLIMAYSRGVDRADEALLASIFHEDSTVVSGVINGSGAEFARGITAFVRDNTERCFHSVANMWIEIDGDHGIGESYVIGTMTTGGNEVMVGGRYIDMFERRGGTWKFASRTFVMDWSTTQPSTYEEGGMFEALTTRGCFGPQDPVYAFWEQ